MTLSSSKIQALLQEPGCDHNHHKDGPGKNKSCQQQAQPGAAQGGCAFDGASITLVPITDAAHLVHGPIACAGNSWNSRGSLSSGPQTYKLGLTTDLSENDIIFGGEKRLYKAIQDVQERYQPAAIFVYSTCVTALIGDDLDAVCAAASQKADIPVIPVHAPGFVGSKNLGNRLAGEALLDHVIGTAEPATTTPYDINLIGEYNIAGEMWNVLPLLERLGIRVLAKMTGDARFEEICYAHRAKLNVLICSKALVNVARKMEERYGIPYIEESFYGIADMNRCLRHIAAKLGDADLQARVEALIAVETAKLNQELEPYRARLRGTRVVLYTGGVKSWSIISAAQDLGIRVVATSTRKSTAEDKARIRDLLGTDGIALEKGGAEVLLETIAQTQADMLIAGGRNQYTALKARIPFLDINQERHQAYAGYAGLVNLARELEEALYSPVWEQVRRPAPWDAAGVESRELGAGATAVTEYGAGSESPIPAEPHPLLPPQRLQTRVVMRKKALSVNPLKQSQPLGAALAFLGIAGAVPLFHGSQGCTAFAKVQLVRHFREAIPLATTAISQVSAILGGEENVGQAIATLAAKAQPALIGLCTTGLTATRGDDLPRILKELRQERPELAGLAIALADTPDFKGALQDGFAAAVEAIVRSVPEPGGDLRPHQVNVLVSAAFGPGDVEAIRAIVESFGLQPLLVPDLSASLDGHLNDEAYRAVSPGGTPVADLRHLGCSAYTLVLGESLRGAATHLEQEFGVPFEVFRSLTGLAETDTFLQALADISGNPVPARYQRERRQLQDALLDTHFYFGHKRIALALEPDLLYAIAQALAATGAEICAAVTTTKSPLLKDLPLDTVTIGDFEDFEALAIGAELAIANSHASASAQRLGIPLYRLGFPILDRLGNGLRCTVGYRGTCQLLFEIGNLFLEAEANHAKSHHTTLSSRAGTAASEPLTASA